METYLNKGIKEIITQFPAIEGILDEYDIGCGPCSVGICLLKDIVQIHRLSPEKEGELMSRITGTIFPDIEIKTPEKKKSSSAGQSSAGPRKFKYSPSIKKLVDEHVLIKRWLALIPEVTTRLDVESEEGRQVVLDGIDMIRSYADKFHHAKEEEILFKYFDETADIFRVIYEDHRQARNHVKAMLEALDSRDKHGVAEHLTAYGSLLTEHIKKEDEILYPWLEEQLSTTQVGELFAAFEKADKQIGTFPLKYQAFISRLEEQFNKRRD